MPHIDTDPKLDFKDVLIRPKRSKLASRNQVSLPREFEFKNSGSKWAGVPIFAANMDTVGTFEMAEALAQHECMVALHKHYTVEDFKSFVNKHEQLMAEKQTSDPTWRDPRKYIAVSTGILERDLEKLAQVLAVTKSTWICVDVANGYTEQFVAQVRRIRQQYPSHVIIAGNVVTGEMTEELILSGADIVKVGIGSGSVCTTRRLTGVGCPQLSAIIECADAAHGLGGRIMSDGGLTCPGDVCKAFAAGADFVMMGGMLAGHDESAGEIEKDAITGKVGKKFYGMSSETAMHKYAGGVAGYRAGEGKTVVVPYRGPVSNTILDILGGLRSCCTYVGASNLKELPRRTTFFMVREQLNNVFGIASSNEPSERVPTVAMTKE
jgi:GMP reductase